MQNNLREIEKEVVDMLSNPLTIDIMELDTDFDKTEKLCKKISLMINSFSVNKKDIIKALCDNEQSKNMFLKISLLWISQQNLNAKNHNYDGRNEYSVSICNVISREREFIELLDDYMLFIPKMDNGLYLSNIFKRAKHYRYTPEQIVVLHINDEHRTLQQTFSGIVFEFIKNYNDGNLNTMLERLISKGILYDNFYHVPFI